MNRWTLVYEMNEMKVTRQICNKMLLYFLRFWEKKLSGPKIKKFLIFSQKKAFPLFRETKSTKKFLIFQETELPYISGNRNSKKLLIFQEMKPCSRSPKKLLIFQERTSKV